MQKKCHYIQFTRKKKKIHFEYKISNVTLTKVDVVCDLGVFLDSKLQFTSHIEYISRVAYKSLGFVLRNAKEFHKISTVIMLFNCFVRS